MEEEMGGVRVCDKVCLGVVSTSSFLSCDKNEFFIVDELLGREFMTMEFLLDDLSSGR